MRRKTCEMVFTIIEEDDGSVRMWDNNNPHIMIEHSNDEIVALSNLLNRLGLEFADSTTVDLGGYDAYGKVYWKRNIKRIEIV